MGAEKSMALASVFCDNMILQRDKEIILFGTAIGNVSASLCGITRSAAVSGDFELRFPSMPAGGPYDLVYTEENHTRILHNVCIGDVLLVTGQSNAELKLRDTDYSDDEIANADPFARVYQVPQLISNDAFDLSWHELTKENALNWSAVGFYLARFLRFDRKVPVGIVCCYQGATPIQTWLPSEHAWEYLFPAEQMSGNWIEDPYRRFNHPAVLRDMMLRRLYPFQSLAVVWYQGESNGYLPEAKCYDEMLKILIGDMRNGFQAPNLPFCIIQINDFAEAKCPEGWKTVQEKQATAASDIPDCFLTVINDLGNADLIHPRNKREAIQRLYSETVCHLRA